LSGAVALGGMILGAVLGGVRGERWHQRLVVRAASPDIGPEADLRAEAERQRRAAEKALERAHKAGVMEVPDTTDAPESPGRTIPAADGDKEGDEEEERDPTRSELATTAAGPRMTPSS